MPELPPAMVYRLEVHFARLIDRNPKWPVLLSEGDSWFSLDTRGNTIDQLPQAGNFALLRLEQSGDELLAILGGGQRAKLRRLIATYPVQALLFSAGGNDIIGPEFEVLLRPFEAGMQAADCLDAGRVSRRLDQLEAGYRDLVELIDEFRDLKGKKRRDVTLLAHGYDYAIPGDRPVKYLFIPISGPWMLPGFKKRKIVDSALQRAVVRILIDGFNDRLARVAADFPGRFRHVDLRGLLKDNEWGDEIHPTRKGYVKVAERFRLELAQLFPGFFLQPIKA
jgi:lysophospholipase L1-like esterase